MLRRLVIEAKDLLLSPRTVEEPSILNIAVVGSPGAGKSTLIRRLLTGKPSSLSMVGEQSGAAIQSLDGQDYLLHVEVGERNCGSADVVLLLVDSDVETSFDYMRTCYKQLCEETGRDELPPTIIVNTKDDLLTSAFDNTKNGFYGSYHTSQEKILRFIAEEVAAQRRGGPITTLVSYATVSAKADKGGLTQHLLQQAMQYAVKYCQNDPAATNLDPFIDAQIRGMLSSHTRMLQALGGATTATQSAQSSAQVADDLDPALFLTMDRVVDRHGATLANDSGMIVDCDNTIQSVRDASPRAAGLRS